MKADCSDQNEIKIYERLAIEADDHPGQAHVMMLKEHFCMEGPNGTHRCHVYETMGPSVTTLMFDRISGESFDEGKSKRFTLRAARAIIYEALLGLDFIHTKSLIHGDFHPGNLLLSVRDLSKLGVEELRQSSSKVSAPVRRLDGKNDHRDPRFLTLDEPLREWVAAGRDFQVKISDLGSCKSAIVVFPCNF
jgi:serine/threonine protein kinase